jgi:hypothetical protein
LLADDVKMFGTTELGATTDAAAAPSRVAERPAALPAVPSSSTDKLALLVLKPE